MWQQNQRLQLHSTDYLSRGCLEEDLNVATESAITTSQHRLSLKGVSGGGSECGNRISDYNFTAQTISQGGVWRRI